MQLREVSPGQLRHQPVALVGELHAHDPAVARIRATAHESPGFRAVHKLNGAVMAQEQISGEIADGRRRAVWMAFDRHKQLVLRMGQADRTSLVLTPVLETAQTDAKRQKVLEVLAGWLRQTGTPPLGRS